MICNCKCCVLFPVVFSALQLRFWFEMSNCSSSSALNESLVDEHKSGYKLESLVWVFTTIGLTPMLLDVMSWHYYKNSNQYVYVDTIYLWFAEFILNKIIRNTEVCLPPKTILHFPYLAQFVRTFGFQNAVTSYFINQFNCCNLTATDMSSVDETRVKLTKL